jgi:hypothetical protein
MQTLSERSSPDKPPRELIAALLPLVRLLAPLVREELARPEATAGDPWVDQKASPLGRREHCRACASGAIKGAQLVKRRWLARRSAIDAFIEAHGAPPAASTRASSATAPRSTSSSTASPASSTPVQASPPPANDVDDDEPTPAEVDAVLKRAGLEHTPRRGRTARKVAL